MAKRKILCFVFADFKKVFDRVPQEVVWLAMCKLGVEEGLVR